MSKDRKNSNGKDVLPERALSRDEPQQLRIFYVRMHDERDKMKLKIDFGDKITFKFNEGKRVDFKSHFSPFISTLDLVLWMDNEKLSVHHENRRKSIYGYYLELSHPGPVYGERTYPEKGSEGHSLKHCFNKQYCFLFGIRFDTKLSGEETNVFAEFCLFTCYLLQNEMAHVFDILVDQFMIVSPSEKNTLEAKEFHDFFEKCYRYLCDVLAKSTSAKVILRMIGVLSIEKENFDRYNQFSTGFANEIMPYVRKNFANLYQSVNEKEWFLFKSGLIMLLCIELLQYKLNNSNENKVTFLQQITDESRRQDMANDLLDQLYKLDQPIFGDSNWTDLFIMVDPTKIDINQLNLTNSFEYLIISITKISKLLKDYSMFEKQIEEYLENRVLLNCIEVDLHSIIYLLEFFEQELSEDSALLSTVRLTITTTGAIREMIEEFLNKLVMNTRNMKEIWLIMRSTSKFQIFQYFNRYEYLQKSLLNAYSSDYYIQWAQWFLAKSQLTDEIEKKKSKKLLESYINRLKDDFTDVLMAIDNILDAFDKSDNHDWFRLYFIDRMIEFCFQQESIFSVIAKNLLFVQNDLFRAQFRKRFYLKHLTDQSQDIFKYMTDTENPLMKLVELDRQRNVKSLLVYDLIELICEKITVTKDELMQDTFYQPTRSKKTYHILFNESLMILPVHKKILQQLISIRKRWERDGFQMTEIISWNQLTTSEQDIACQIWNLVGKHLEKNIEFKQLIDETKRKTSEIIKTIENVTLCVKTYCQDACDQNNYLSLLQDLRSQFDQGTFDCGKMSVKIEELKPFADQLRSVISSCALREYVAHNLESKKVHNVSHLSCLETLKQVTEMLDHFRGNVKLLYTDTKHPLLPQLKRLIPGKYNIDRDLNVLQLLPNNDTRMYVNTLLEYWKDHELINHICRGFQIMLSQYKAPSSVKLLVLQQILDIDDQTSGETCIAIYQHYRDQYSDKYSTLTLELIAQWSQSNELLTFLYALKPTDIDDLLEIVDGSDETSINTKIILDLMALKKFFDTADIKIGSIRRKKFLEVEEIICCFEEVLNNGEFKKIISSIESCSRNLLCIKRIRMGSENKQ